ncbi:MAG: GGDEF domain-containing protein, partial [Candidatus Binatia bacterium]
MPLPIPVPEFLQEWTATQWLPFLLLLIAIFVWRRAGLVFARLEVQNRKLKRGIRGYERMEQEHVELSQENRERNAFHAELGPLITRLNLERTARGVCDLIVEFTARVLGASEVSLFLVEGGSLLGTSARGVSSRALRVRIGEGRIGAIARFGRVFVLDDFRNLDPETRDRLAAGSGAIDTVAGAPLVAHGSVIGVLNIGGLVRASASIHREVLSVVAHLGATAVENQLNFERLEREATTDGLTGLSNVRNFKEKLRQELARAARYGRVMSVFLFDIDNFKHYNDRNGHPAGDECLRRTGELLRRSTRTSDLPARYGGEEFVVLLPETDAAGGLAFAEKIRGVIAAHDYPHREAQPLGCVSISGGVASFTRDGTVVDILIAAADKALYRAKHAGRNRVLTAEGRAAS